MIPELEKIKDESRKPLTREQFNRMSRAEQHRKTSDMLFYLHSRFPALENAVESIPATARKEVEKECQQIQLVISHAAAVIEVLVTEAEKLQACIEELKGLRERVNKATEKTWPNN
jgi:chromosome segregation ATPase